MLAVWDSPSVNIHCTSISRIAHSSSLESWRTRHPPNPAVTPSTPSTLLPPLGAYISHEGTMTWRPSIWRYPSSRAGDLIYSTSEWCARSWDLDTGVWAQHWRAAGVAVISSGRRGGQSDPVVVVLLLTPLFANPSPDAFCTGTAHTYVQMPVKAPNPQGSSTSTARVDTMTWRASVWRLPSFRACGASSSTFPNAILPLPSAAPLDAQDDTLFARSRACVGPRRAVA
ncbi:hypothetical protein FB45DRAFT_1026296 [Roridomyces roridus]|uniref:Uncharacterized protein n=1 Tax=Roridomyces roridus TaxID=1738132 RepID=A0AAD7C0F3_9AGAR|nr:hypothetical protein FB45DRAFT_1026296 [Roridomyces roridus]